MEQERYWEELEKQLSKLTAEEREEALAYHREYALDGGLESYEALVQALGTPKELAGKIYAESALKTLETKKGNWIKPFGIGLLAFCSLPMTLPLGIALVAVAFALLATLVAVLLAVGSSVLATGISAGALFVRSFGFLVVLNFPAWLQCLGASLVLGVITAVLLLVGYGLLRLAMRGLTKLMSKRVTRRNDK